MVPCIRVVRGAPAVGRVPVLVRGKVVAVGVEVGRSMLVHKLERTYLDNHNHKDWPLAFLFDLKTCCMLWLQDTMQARVLNPFLCKFNNFIGHV